MPATVCCLFFLLFSLFQLRKKLENKAETLYLQGKIQAKNFSATDPGSGTETKKRKKRPGRTRKKEKKREKREKKKERERGKGKREKETLGHFERDKRNVLKRTGTKTFKINRINPSFCRELIGDFVE
ncbi:MAG: hypothetical protein ACLSX5_12870 [Lachnospiraceae bacterium]